MAVYGTDIIGSADPRIPEDIRIKKKEAFKKILLSCQILNDLEQKHKVIEKILTGDGYYIVVRIDHANRLIPFAVELKKRLDEYNQAQEDERSSIKIKSGINVGSVKTDTLNDISGSAIDYAERILNIGKENHILLTHSAVTTILALDSKYEGFFSYCYKYPIKHGEELDVYLYHEGSVGNPDCPPKSIRPAIFDMTKINQVLGIVLLSFSITALFINGYTYAENLGRIEELGIMNYQEKGNLIRTTLGEKVTQIRIYEEEYREIVKRELMTSMESLNSMPSLNSTSEADYSSSVLNLLKATSFTITEVNSDIDYVIIASVMDGKCDAKVYEPFGDRTEVKDWSNQPWCKNYQKSDYYLSHTYFSSGANTFINTLRGTIRVGGIEQNTVGYLLFAIDWNNILKGIIKEANIKNLDIVLVDNNNNIAAACYDSKTVCDDFKNYINKGISSSPKTFVLDEFEKNGYEIREIELPSARELDFGSRSQVLDGWKIYMRYPVEETMSEIENTGNTIILGINLVIVVLLVCYYLTPRYWFSKLANNRPVIPAGIK